jgi:hypothetical protein
MTIEESRAVTAISTLKFALSRDTPLDDVIRLQAQAETVRCLIKKARLGLQMHNEAAAFKLRAERRAGEMLASLNLRGGRRTPKSHAGTLRLEDFGISRNQSSRWQREAAVPESEFEAYLKEAETEEREVTAAELLRRAKRYTASPQRRAKKQTRQAAVPADPSSSCRPVASVDDLVDEIGGHAKTLATLLLPFCEHQIRPTSAELRYAASLLRDVSTLVDHLREMAIDAATRD